MRRRIFLVFAVLIAAAPAGAAAIHDIQNAVAEAAKSPGQTRMVRTTAGIDTSGWVLIAVVHGPDAALIKEGQQVLAFSVNARTRIHMATITRVTRQSGAVRVEAKLAVRTLGIATRYLMEIVTESI
jgi:hypothetical protein